MIFKRVIALLILCMPISMYAILQSESDSLDEKNSDKNIAPHIDSLGTYQSNSEQEFFHSPLFIKQRFCNAMYGLKPFVGKILNVACACGIGYGLYRYVPDKLPWIWAGTTTYSSLILSAAIISYGKENQSLKEQREALIKERNALEKENLRLQPLQLNADKQPEVIVGNCSGMSDNREERLKERLKLQQEKTAEWCNKANELEIENKQLKNFRTQYYHLRADYLFMLNEHNQLQQKLNKYNMNFNHALAKIAALEETNQSLEQMVRGLQDDLNAKKRNQAQVQSARDRVNGLHQNKLLNSWVSVKS